MNEKLNYKMLSEQILLRDGAQRSFRCVLTDSLKVNQSRSQSQGVSAWLSKTFGLHPRPKPPALDFANITSADAISWEMRFAEIFFASETINYATEFGQKFCILSVDILLKFHQFV